MPSCRASVLAGAYALDLALGDPLWFPHPVRCMGALIAAAQRAARPPQSPRRDFASGALLTCGLTASSWLLCRAAQRWRWLGVVLAWTTLATTSLLEAASAVAVQLERDDLPAARLALSQIVGRDTEHLNASEIARATVETVAESLCDGIVAPLFFLVLGGTPAAMAYKAVNTLDSIIGHIEPPYTWFGRFAARADDAANFLPARITALLIALASGRSTSRALATCLRDGGKHASPNAGRPEAAMAGALGVRLGGLNYYDGQASAKPYIGAQFRTAVAGDVRRSMSIARRVSLLAFLCGLLYTGRRRLR